MKVFVRSAFVIATAVTIAGCRQPDGPMPMTNEHIEEELHDIARDLQNCAGNNATAPSALADDVRDYATHKEPAYPAVDELSRRTAAAVRGKKVDDQMASRLAHTLWAAVAARQVSDRQVEGMQNDMHSMLVSIGVSEDAAKQVADQIGVVQKQVTDRQRR